MTRFSSADCGLPLARTGPVVDLAVVPGMPPFTAVLDALLDELVVESALAAEECWGGPAEEWIRGRLPAAEYIPHEELKGLTAAAKILVRTGEATPYANVVLRCGVPF